MQFWNRETGQDTKLYLNSSHIYTDSWRNWKISTKGGGGCKSMFWVEARRLDASVFQKYKVPQKDVVQEQEAYCSCSMG